MLFKDIIANHQLKKHLCESVQAGRVPHAQLLLGAEGSGALPLAIAYAQYLECEQPLKNDACGVCKTCIKAAKWIHPDIHFSYPVVGTGAISTQFLTEWRKAIQSQPYMSKNEWLNLLGAENKQGNINKDECNDILRKLSFTNYEGRYKILIMWLPEYLGKEGNRLLKLIEEPPDKTIFLLVAEQSDLILNTILSRCQLVKMEPLSDEDIANALLERQYVSDSSQAYAVAYLSDGNFAKAVQLSHTINDDQSTQFLEWFRLCYKGDAKGMVAWVEQFSAWGREKHKYFLQYALHFLRELLVHISTKEENLRLRENEKQTAINMARVMNFRKIERVAALLNDCFYFVERNANPKVLFLDACISIHKYMHE